MMDRWAHALETIHVTLSQEEFPHTRALIPDAAEFTSERRFEYGLNAILNGVAHGLTGSTPMLE
jgi:hypothetical protein